EAQLTVPANGPLGRDPHTGAEHSGHAAESCEPDHEVQRRADSRPAEVVLVPVRAGDCVVEDEREPEGEDVQALVPEGPQELVARVADRVVHAATASSSSAVSCRNASSRPAPRTSMSDACGYASRKARSVWSESDDDRTTASPWRSAVVPAGSFSRASIRTA